MQPVSREFCVSTLALGYQSPGGLQCPQVLYLKTDFDTPESNRITAYQSSSNRLCHCNVEVTKNFLIDLHIQQLVCLKVLISHKSIKHIMILLQMEYRT